MPRNFKAQVTLSNATGQPKDRYVNTFHFYDNTVLSESDAADAIYAALSAFYCEVEAGTNRSIFHFISPQVVRDTGSPLGPEVRIYNLADPEPRDPVYSAKMDMTPAAALNNTAMPHELAVCLSFYASHNAPRKRGRIYIGPLDQAAFGPASAGDVTVATTLRTVLTQQALKLIGEYTPTNLLWAVRGKGDIAGAPHILRPVTAGWVDNRADIIRGRGSAPTDRTVFAS